MKGSIEHARVAINIMRARLTILGFNLAIITFQISNTRGLGGGTRLEGFETTVHLSTGTVLLIGLALTIASMVVFIASSSFAREGTCDGRMLLAGDLLMYPALAQTTSEPCWPHWRWMYIATGNSPSARRARRRTRFWITS